MFSTYFALICLRFIEKLFLFFYKLYVFNIVMCFNKCYIVFVCVLFVRVVSVPFPSFCAVFVVIAYAWHQSNRSMAAMRTRAAKFNTRVCKVDIVDTAFDSDTVTRLTSIQTDRDRDRSTHQLEQSQLQSQSRARLQTKTTGIRTHNTTPARPDPAPTTMIG
jgi:hypothetical protein